MECKVNEETKCPEWEVVESCDTGTHCDEAALKCTDGCAEICDEQHRTKCGPDGVMECEPDSAGCAAWNTVQHCDVGFYCDETQVKCVEGCEAKCDPGALDKCENGNVVSCESDSAGCAVYETTVCEPGTYCDEEQVICVPCKETCNPDALKRCTDKGVESCTADARGCAEWKLTETCQENQSCDAADMKCIDGCKDACKSGEKKCDNNGVAVCKDTNGNGCMEWDKPEACKDGFKCDEASKSCVCKNECAEGEKKCEGNTLARCTKNANGCLSWTKAACGTSKYCDATKKSCEYTCGADCDPFSIILLPDTQNYSKVPTSEVSLANSIYTKQMKWIKDNKKGQNIRAVIHLGDITDNNEDAQWKVASYAHKLLDEANIPYTMGPGNHDYKSSDSVAKKSYPRSRTKVWDYFGASRFKGKSWFHESPYTGNTFATFNVGQIKFLILAFEFSPRRDVVCWADEMLKKYPDHHVIIETHGYLTTNSGAKNPDGTYKSPNSYSGHAYLPDATYGDSGYDLFNEIVARHNNVIMAVGGHVGDTEWRQKKGRNGNTITEMLVDYQFDAPCKKSKPEDCTDSCRHNKNAGNGWFRQLVFDPKTNKIQAKTLTVLPNTSFAGNKPAFYCSEYQNTKIDGSYRKWYSADVKNSDHQFSFTQDFSTPVDYKYNTGNYIGFGIRNINANGSGEQNNPVIAMNRGTGGFVAVWEDDSSALDGTVAKGPRKGGNNHDIMARIFYPGGCQKAAQFLVSQADLTKGSEKSSKGDQITPKAAMDSKGNFVVVWVDDTDGNGYYEIMMRGFDENGKERFARRVVNSKADGQQRNPAIAMRSDGKFVIAWEDESDSASTPQIFIRGFNADGSELFHDRNVDTLKGVRRKPDVAIADDGNFVVTWEDDSDMNGAFQVYAKGFAPDGKDRIKMYTVNSVADNQQLNPSVSMNEDGNYYVAYEDDADGNGVFRIKARGYDKSGKQIMADRYISDAGEGAVTPVVCAGKNSKGDKVIFGWTATKRAKGDVRRRIYENKTLGSTTSNVNQITAGVQNQPALGCTNSGKYAFLWHDDLDENGYYEIFGRGFN